MDSDSVPLLLVHRCGTVYHLPYVVLALNSNEDVLVYGWALGTLVHNVMVKGTIFLLERRWGAHLPHIGF